MQTVNEVRMTILNAFYENIQATYETSDEDALCIDVEYFIGVARKALEAAMPKVGDSVVVEHIVLIDGDTDEEIERGIEMVGMAGSVGTLYKDGVVLRGSSYFATYDEIANASR